MPVKYAPMSVTLTTDTENSSRMAPLAPPTSMRSRVKNWASPPRYITISSVVPRLPITFSVRCHTAWCKNANANTTASASISHPPTAPPGPPSIVKYGKIASATAPNCANARLGCQPNASTNAVSSRAASHTSTPTSAVEIAPCPSQRPMSVPKTGHSGRVLAASQASVNSSAASATAIRTPNVTLNFSTAPRAWTPPGRTRVSTLMSRDPPAGPAPRPAPLQNAARARRTPARPHTGAPAGNPATAPA
jgi:hypothetical protein